MKVSARSLGRFAALLGDSTQSTPVSFPSDKAREWAIREIPRLCAAPSTLTVLLFGSAVRNVTSPTDLDVLYVYDGLPSETSKPPIDVDLRAFERNDLEAQLRAGNDLLVWCMHYGRLLCEKNSYWTNCVESWRHQVGLPSEAVALERAQKSERLLRQMASAGDYDAALEIYVAMLTQLARAKLISRGIYPASRPELADQLLKVDENELAGHLNEALNVRNLLAHGIKVPKKRIWDGFLGSLEQARQNVKTG